MFGIAVSAKFSVVKQRSWLGRSKLVLVARMGDRLACSMSVDEAITEVSKEIRVVFKEKQYSAIKSFCQGNDSFVSLPTGYGKSLIFAVLPMIMDKIKGMPTYRSASSHATEE